MTWIPGEQHAVGDTEAGIKGPVVLGHDQATGLIAPLMGSEGTQSGNRAPISNEPGRFGILGWLYSIWNIIHNDIPAEVQGVGTAVTNAQTALSNQINSGIQIQPMGQVGDGATPFQPAVDENFDPDSFFNRYPLYLKAGTKMLKVAVDATIGLTDTELRATAVPVSIAAIPAAPGVALDATVTAVTTSLGTDGAAPPVIAGTGVRGFLRAIYDRLVAGIGVTGTFWQATQPVSGTFFQATQPVSGPLTDAQLRTSAVPVSLSSTPLPTDAATQTTLALIKAKTDNLDVALSTRTKAADQQHVLIDSPTGLTDTQLRATAVPVSATNLDVALSTRTKPSDQQHVIVDTMTPGLALDATVSATNTSLGTDGATPPSIPGTGVRGWLRSIYDKLTLLVAVFPTTLDMNSGNKSASTMRVVIATDQPTQTNKQPVTATTDQSSHGTSDLVADDLIKWAGTTLSAPTATSPDGTQTAPVMRSLNRKFTTIETSTPLASNAVFTGAWHDSNLTGDSYVVATSLSDKVGAQFVIEESDDTNNASFTRTVATWNGAPTANTLSYMVGVIRVRFWRVKYTNGATLQTTFELTTCAQTTCPDTVLTNNTSSGNNNQTKTVVAYQPGGAGAGSDNLSLFMTWIAQNAAGGGPQDVVVRFHGGKFSGTTQASKIGASMARTPTVFKQVSTRATGNTALWTPLTGNKFRALRFKIQITADTNTAAQSQLTIGLQDATTDIGVSHIVSIPATAGVLTTQVSDGYDSGWIDLGQFGYLSTAANAVLNVNLSEAVLTGLVNVIVAGTEE